MNCESENPVHLWKREIILVLLTLSIVSLCRTGMNLKILKNLNVHLFICVFLNFLDSLLKEPVELVFFVLYWNYRTVIIMPLHLIKLFSNILPQ